jgi:hypothetical protein
MYGLLIGVGDTFRCFGCVIHFWKRQNFSFGIVNIEEIVGTVVLS